MSILSCAGYKIDPSPDLNLVVSSGPSSLRLSSVTKSICSGVALLFNRSDEHGEVTHVRSDQYPEGWGHHISEEGNQILERVFAVCLRLLERNATFALENPADSFAWETRWMKKLAKKKGVQWVVLDQCCYSAQTVQPTGVLTNADWMASVKLRCSDVRPHRHLKEGLRGKTWDPCLNKMVWKTARAAEYPQGLCVAWAESLKAWAATSACRIQVGSNFVRCGRHSNVLVREDLVASAKPATGTAEPRAEQLSKSELREQQNPACIGGLRDPRRAVARSPSLQSTGVAVREVIERFLSPRVLDSFERAPNACPFDDELVLACRRELAERFSASAVSATGYQAELFECLMAKAQDPDAQVLPKWLRQGFPLGITQEITHTGVFPRTDDVSAAIKAPQVNGILLEDWDGSATNYRSFEEVSERSQAELDRMVAEGRAVTADTWDEVVQLLGPAAKLTRLACIVKQKDDGSEKVRLIVDVRRSRINGLIFLTERVVLPRIAALGKGTLSKP